MIAARLTVPLLLLASTGVLAALLASWGRSDRRRAARAAEIAARPHSNRVGTAEQDAAAIAHQAIREGWTEPTEDDGPPHRGPLCIPGDWLCRYPAGDAHSDHAPYVEGEYTR